MTKTMRENRENYCLFCVEHRAKPYCSRSEMLPGCPWLDADEQPEEDQPSWLEEDEAIIHCTCCGKEKFIPSKELWVYKKEHKQPGNFSYFDFYCSYTCWRKEEKYFEDVRKKAFPNCA